MQVNEPSQRYSHHGNGWIKVYRKILTSAVFENPNMLKIWVWCLIRANWTETTTMFDGGELELQIGQFVTGRYTGSGECNMSPTTFYGNLKKLEQIGNITLKSDNKKTLVTIVNYSSYQDELALERQQHDNKPTTNRQQTDTDKEVKKERSKECTYKTSKEKPTDQNEVISYFLSISGSRSDSLAWWDYHEANGWKVGKNPIKDWRATCRTWMRNKSSFSQKPVAESPKRKKDTCKWCGQQVDSFLLHELNCPKAPQPASKEAVESAMKNINDLTNQFSVK
jgi:hypothetical protein